MTENVDAMLGVSGTQGHDAASTSGPSVGAATSAAISRYRDAYRVASTIIVIGSAVKVCGHFLAFVGIAAVLVKSQHGFGTSSIAWLIGTVLAWLNFFVAGVVISAQGQTLRATLDAAVHGSPFLDRAAKARAMSL